MTGACNHTYSPYCGRSPAVSCELNMNEQNRLTIGSKRLLHEAIYTHNLLSFFLTLSTSSDKSNKMTSLKIIQKWVFQTGKLGFHGHCLSFSSQSLTSNGMIDRNN